LWISDAQFHTEKVEDTIGVIRACKSERNIQYCAMTNRKWIKRQFYGGQSTTRKTKDVETLTPPKQR